MGLGSFSCEAVTLPGIYLQEAPAADLAGPRHDLRYPLPLTQFSPSPATRAQLYILPAVACQGAYGSFTWLVSAD